MNDMSRKCVTAYRAGFLLIATSEARRRQGGGRRVPQPERPTAATDPSVDRGSI